MCVVRNADGQEIVIGLCELEVEQEIQPGDSGEGCLSFAVAVADEARTHLPVGSRMTLAEGKRPIGTAAVLGIDRPKTAFTDHLHRGGA